MTFKFEPKDIDALLIGLGIFGTGGGGDPEWGREILENDFARGRVCELINPEDVADDAFVCSGGIMGSVKALENFSYSEIVRSWEKDFVLEKAFGVMETLKGRKLDAIIPFEVGGLNTPVIMTLAARLGIPMVNGDAVGRAAPETQMTTFVGYGMSLYPMPLVDYLGNTIVAMKANELTYADEIGRIVVTKGGGLGGNSHYPMTGADLKRACVPHTVTKAIEIGNTITAANASGKDPVEAFRKLVGGKLMFSGSVREVTGEDKGGFYLTNVKLNGIGAFGGQAARLVVKNETMVLWVNEEIRIIFPDNAYLLYPNTGKGVMSVDIKEGLEISLVGAPCSARLRQCLETDAGKTAFGGARYGYPELSFQKFEDLNP
jgi:DUF917 family protein